MRAASETSNCVVPVLIDRFPNSPNQSVLKKIRHDD